MLRKPHVREVPIAPGLMAALVQQFNLKELQRDPETANRRLWPMSRVTAWRVVKGAMLEAGIVGRPACPRGLRHGFGVGTLQASVPLNMVQKWMGHARMSTTAIYADASGDEEAALAARISGTADEHIIWPQLSRTLWSIQTLVRSELLRTIIATLAHERCKKTGNYAAVENGLNSTRPKSWGRCKPRKSSDPATTCRFRSACWPRDARLWCMPRKRWRKGLPVCLPS